MHTPRILAAVALTALLSATAACGNNSDKHSALPQAATTNAQDPSPVDGEKVNPEDAMLEYAKCMREHGVDMPDPGPGTGAVEIGGDVDMDTMNAANKACDSIIQQVMQNAPANNIDNDKFNQMFLDQAKCLREKGYDVPDPVFQGNGAIMGGEYPENAHGPAFDKAMQECNDKVGLGDMQSFTASSGVQK